MSGQFRSEGWFSRNWLECIASFAFTNDDWEKFKTPVRNSQTSQESLHARLKLVPESLMQSFEQTDALLVIRVVYQLLTQFAEVEVG